MDMKDVNTIVAIIGIVLIECVALTQGIDGILMGGAIAAIAALGGYQLARQSEEASSKST